MKIVLLILVGVAIAGCVCVCVHEEDGCRKRTYVGGGVSLSVCKVEGHDYIVANHGGHGVSVVHAASCPCLKPRNYSIEELVTTNRFPDIRDYIEKVVK